MNNLVKALYSKVRTLMALISKLAGNLDNATEGQILKAKGDGTAEFGDSAGGGKKYATIVVGNIGAGHTLADCDYLCDGVADDVELNAIMDYLWQHQYPDFGGFYGGKILMLAGTYYISNRILIQTPNVEICGENFGSVILESTQPFGEIDNSSGFLYVSNRDNVRYKNLVINAKFQCKQPVINFDPYGVESYGCGMENIRINKMYEDVDEDDYFAVRFSNTRDCYAKNVYTNYQNAVYLYDCINADIDSVIQRTNLEGTHGLVVIYPHIGYGKNTIQNCSTEDGGFITNGGYDNFIVNNDADVMSNPDDSTSIITGNRSGNITSVVSNSDLYDVIIGSTNAGHTLTDCDFLCDGETDSTTILSAIQHAINNYTSDRPKILFLTSEYILESPILIDFDGQIQFSGDKENPPIIARCWDAGESEDYMFSSLNCCLFFYGINLQTMLRDVPVPSIGNHCVKSPWVKFEYCALRNFAGTVGEELGSGDTTDGTYINVLNSRIQDCPLGIMTDLIEKSEFQDTPVRLVYPEGQIVSDNLFSSSWNYDPYDVLTVICGTMTSITNNRFNCGAIEQPATVIVIDEFSQNCLVANNIAPYGVIIDNGTDDFIEGAASPTHVEYVTLLPENWSGGPPHQTVAINKAFSAGAILRFYMGDYDQQKANAAYLSFINTSGTEISFGVSATPTEEISLYVIEVGNNIEFEPYGGLPINGLVDFKNQNTSPSWGSYDLLSFSWDGDSRTLNLGYYPIAEAAIIMYRAVTNAEAWKTAGGAIIGLNENRSALNLVKTGELSVDVTLQICVLPNIWSGEGLIMDWT